RSLAELVESRIHAFPCSGEINFKVHDAAEATRAVLAHYASLAPELDNTDGISADFGTWRFNLRSSNTEPLLRLNVETRADSSLLQERTQELSEIISSHNS